MWKFLRNKRTQHNQNNDEVDRAKLGLSDEDQEVRECNVANRRIVGRKFVKIETKLRRL